MEYQEGNVIIDGIKIHYYRSGGKKPPIVLLHGATDDGLCWGRTAQELAERYDVIMPDAQGAGEKDGHSLGQFRPHRQSQSAWVDLGALRSDTVSDYGVR